MQGAPSQKFVFFELEPCEGKPNSGDEGSCSPEPGSPLLPTCGVGRCRCGGLADLQGTYKHWLCRKGRCCALCMCKSNMHVSLGA